MFAVFHIIRAETGIKQRVDFARLNVRAKAENQIGK
jgi:hypothetical protein